MLKATFPLPETKATAGQCLASGLTSERKFGIRYICKQKAKEFRRTETLVIMLLLSYSVMYSTLRQRRGRNNWTEEKDGVKKQFKKHGEQMHPSVLFSVKQLTGW